MALIVQTTGLEEYAPGGRARIKVLAIGGPGAGKTRWASYFPRPIYADCERGLASVADRRVPFVNIDSSQDMLDLLAHLKQECRQPGENRQYQTVVIDTLDAFQRKIKNEWMEKEKKPQFQGWEAWGYLNAKMQMLMTRLLNLDMNVVVNCHYKDKTTKDDETGKESHELMLQLQGELSDTAFNDFDLVGWLGTYWEAVDGVRVQKRGITFKPTPDKPFLKDRLHVTPPWLEIDFAPSDYGNLFEAVEAKILTLSANTIVGQIVSETITPGAFVTAPGILGSGAISGAAQAATNLSYLQMDKPTLAKLCRDRGITATVDGTPIKGNTLKAELIAALEKAPETPAQDGDATTTTTPAPAPAATEPAAAAQSAGPAPEPAVAPEPPVPPVPAPEVANTRRTRVSAPIERVSEGVVNTETGELIAESTPAAQAIATLKDTLGAEVIEEVIEDVAPDPQPGEALEPAQEAQACEMCGTSLGDEDPDIVKLSWIKYRKRLCARDFKARKANR